MASLYRPVSERFHAALAYASALHAKQGRKGTSIPYISHLLGVAAIVLDADGTEDEAIAALLHDGPEDQGGRPTLDAIRDRFGDVVADIVEGCSDTFETPKPPWPERKSKYIEHLKKAGKSTLLVSAADKLHNARATLRDQRNVGETVWRRFSAGRNAILANYESIAQVYAEGAEDSRRKPIARELRDILAEMNALR